MVKFLRRTWSRYSKLGKGRKKKQVWRRPTGRDNKMRERRKGYPVRVEIGYKQEKNSRKEIIQINNIKDFAKIKNNAIIVFGKMGQKKKIEMAKEAKEKKIKVSNLNIEKFLKGIEKKKKKKEVVKEEKKKEKKTESAPKSVSSNEGKEKSEETKK
jgi:large subunit ribosomal protein L32e